MALRSDSSFLHAVGFDGLLEMVDDGGWSREVLPMEDAVFLGGAGTDGAADGGGDAAAVWEEALLPLEAVDAALKREDAEAKALAAASTAAAEAEESVVVDAVDDDSDSAEVLS